MVVPFASRATKRIARKAPSRKGCAKIERSLCRAPWRRRPGYDLRRASSYHLDFLCNAAHVRLVQGFHDAGIGNLEPMVRGLKFKFANVANMQQLWILV